MYLDLCNTSKYKIKQKLYEKINYVFFLFFRQQYFQGSIIVLNALDLS